MGLNKLYFAASIYAEEHIILHSAHLVSQGERCQSQIQPMKSSVSVTVRTLRGEMIKDWQKYGSWVWILISMLNSHMEISEALIQVLHWKIVYTSISLKFM